MKNKVIVSVSTLLAILSLSACYMRTDPRGSRFTGTPTLAAPTVTPTATPFSTDGRLKP